MCGWAKDPARKGKLENLGKVVVEVTRGIKGREQRAAGMAERVPELERASELGKLGSRGS